MSDMLFFLFFLAFLYAINRVMIDLKKEIGLQREILGAILEQQKDKPEKPKGSIDTRLQTIADLKNQISSENDDAH